MIGPDVLRTFDKAMIASFSALCLGALAAILGLVLHALLERFGGRK